MRHTLLLAALLAAAPGCISPFAAASRAPAALLPEVPGTTGLPGGGYASGGIQAIGNLAAPPSSTASAHVALGPATVGLNFNTGPLGYITETGMDSRGLTPMPGEIRGEACATGIFIPLAAVANYLGLQIPDLDISWGDGGYEAAVENAFTPGVTAIADVRADAHVFSVLSIFGQRCTVVHARGYR